MPNISSHMIVATLVGKELGINSFDYYRGNLLPDIMKGKDSHHRLVYGPLFIPDVNYFLKNLDLNKDINIGYLVHILLDYHYLTEYIPSLYPNRNIFEEPNKLVYKDYDYLNHDLVERFNLDVDTLSRALAYFPMKVDKKKLKYNIRCLNQNTCGKTTFLNIDSFANFLSEVSNVISEEMKDYVSQYRDMHVRTR